MINGRCNKSDFTVFSVVNQDKNVYDIRWGYEDVVINELLYDEKTGMYNPTGKLIKTNECSYVVERIFVKPTQQLIDDLFKNSEKQPSMFELKSFSEFLGLSDNDTLQWMKEQMKRTIIRFDASSSINNFTVGGVNMWLDKITRTGLLLRFQAEKAVGKIETVLWHEDMQFSLPIDNAIQMLYAIELYASATYNKTAEHLANINKLESVDALIAYDYKVGYPTQLEF